MSHTQVKDFVFKTMSFIAPPPRQSEIDTPPEEGNCLPILRRFYIGIGMLKP